MICRIRDLDVYTTIAGEGTPVVMVHGFGVDHRTMTGCLEPLSPQVRQFLDLFLVDQRAEHCRRFQGEMQAGFECGDPAFQLRLRQDMAAYSFSFDVDDLPAPYRGPSLILAGRQDCMVGYRDAWKLLKVYPRAAYAVLDRAGHALQIEQPALFSALVHEWLDRVQSEAW